MKQGLDDETQFGGGTGDWFHVDLGGGGRRGKMRKSSTLVLGDEG